MESRKPLIKLENITRTYRNGELSVPVLHGIDLQIEAGEFVAIVGASGSGKTTLMNILGCLDQASSGRYEFRGEDVALLDHDGLAQLRREAFGFIFQSYNLISTASARENVEVPAVYAGFPAEERHERASTLLGDLGLGDRVDHKPNQLSGGQQQRVSIARALMNGGQVILADEPTGALDSKSGRDVMTLLSELSQQGHTIILITHDADVAAHADRMIEMRDGRVLSDQSKREAKIAAVSNPHLHPGASALSDIFEASLTAFRSLRANIFRSVLTLLGVMIGVASVIVMLAIR
ncbi:ATP-binding cassette domain-containing protein [Thiomicrorhabdus sp.]|uniref:ATP-binding cassette domain-containing protein n=1 Tax=Thiomicrorhabdus sp. TaxID=2039724 RepID=UPI0029C9603D|nr:ATP-binding cassette domain-containing protein [Thiomicrorhabdus sp.]